MNHSIEAMHNYWFAYLDHFNRSLLLICMISLISMVACGILVSFSPLTSMYCFIVALDFKKT